MKRLTRRHLWAIGSTLAETLPVLAAFGIFTTAAAAEPVIRNANPYAPVGAGILAAGVLTMFINKIETGDILGYADRPVRFLWRAAVIVLGSSVLFAAITIAVEHWLGFLASLAIYTVLLICQMGDLRILSKRWNTRPQLAAAIPEPQQGLVAVAWTGHMQDHLWPGWPAQGTGRHWIGVFAADGRCLVVTEQDRKGMGKEFVDGLTSQVMSLGYRVTSDWRSVPGPFGAVMFDVEATPAADLPDDISKTPWRPTPVDAKTAA